jgi:hypothetical protein
MSGDVFVNIDRIVLHGLGHIDRQELETALQKALTEQLKAQSIGHPFETPRVRTELTLPASFNAGQVGRSLAQNLCGVISDTGAARSPGSAGKQGGQSDA